MSTEGDGGQHGVAPYTVNSVFVKLLEPRLMEVSTSAVDEVPCNRRGGHYGSFLEVRQPYKSAAADECDMRTCEQVEHVFILGEGAVTSGLRCFSDT